MGKSDERLIRHVGLHGFVASVAYSKDLARYLDVVFAGYPAVDQHVPVDLPIEITLDDETLTIWFVSCDGTVQRELTSNRAAAKTEWLVITHAIQSWDKYIHAHAALVGNGRSSALLIGRSGSGKSTTSVAMAALGWDLYSDDVALIGRGDFAAWTCPRPIKLDDISRELLAPMGITVQPELTVQESVARTSLPGLPPVEEPGPRVSCAFFFAGRHEPKPHVRAIPKSESALRLMLQSSTDFDEVEGLSAEAYSLISSIACFELVPGELPETAALIAHTINSLAG